VPDLFTIGMKKLRDKLSQKEVCNYILRNRIKILIESIKDKKSSYIESNPQSIYVIPELLKSFRNIRFLYIVRDPKDTINSLYNLSPVKDLAKMQFYGENDHRKRINPTDFPDDNFKYEWNILSRIGKISWYWNKANSIIYNSLKDTEGCMIIKFEDLFSSRRSLQWENLWDLTRFLGISNCLIKDKEIIGTIFSEKMNE
jgi:hypothetical protein